MLPPTPPVLASTLALITTTPPGAEVDQDKPVLLLDLGGHYNPALPIKDVAFAPSGEELITVAKDMTIRFWSVASGEPARMFCIELDGDRPLLDARFSPDGRRLAVATTGA